MKIMELNDFDEPIGAAARPPKNVRRHILSTFSHLCTCAYVCMCVYKMIGNLETVINS